MLSKSESNASKSKTKKSQVKTNSFGRLRDGKMFSTYNYELKTIKSNDAKRYVIPGRSSPSLSQKLDEFYNVGNKYAISNFRDGEVKLVFKNLLGKEVVIVQSSCPPIHDNLVELLLTIKNAKRQGAEHITAIVPYLAYTTKDKLRQNMLCTDVAFLLEKAGVHQVVIIEGHSDQSIGSFSPNISSEMLTIFETSLPYLMVNSSHLFNLDENVCVVSPDANGLYRTKVFKNKFVDVRRRLNLDLENTLDNEHPVSNAVVYVERDINEAAIETVDTLKAKDSFNSKSSSNILNENLEKNMDQIVVNSPHADSQNLIKNNNLIGDVRDQTCVVIDDIIYSGKTMLDAISTLKENGAKEVIVYVTHCYANEQEFQALYNSDATKIYVSNTIEHSYFNEKKYRDKLVVIDISKLIIQVIENIYNKNDLAAIETNM